MGAWTAVTQVILPRPRAAEFQHQLRAAKVYKDNKRMTTFAFPLGLRSDQRLPLSPRKTSSIVVDAVFIALALTLGSSSVPRTWICRSSCFAACAMSPTMGIFGQLGLSVVKVMLTFLVLKS